MNDFVIVTDSASDTDAATLQGLGVACVNLSFRF